MRLQPLAVMVDGKVALVLLDHENSDAYVPRLVIEPTLAAFQAANAAPDMLAALEAVLVDIRPRIPVGPQGYISQQTIERIGAALAKARDQGPSADQE